MTKQVIAGVIIAVALVVFFRYWQSGKLRTLVSGNTNCGQVSSLHVLNDAERTPKEERSLECFANKIAACKPGELHTEGPDGALGLITIKGVEGADCQLHSLVKTTSRTCRLPLTFLEELGIVAQAEGNKFTEVVGTVIYMMGGNSISNLAGEQITAQCQDAIYVPALKEKNATTTSTI